MTETLFTGNFVNLPGHGSGPNSGYTPFLNGSLNDHNLFEAQYDVCVRESRDFSHRISQQHTSFFEAGRDEASHESINHDVLVKSLGEQDVINRSGKSPNSSKSSDETTRKGGKGKLQQEGPEERGKRNRFLARNRLAASKCRTKKKEWTNNLEAAARQASQQSRELQAILQGLRDEVLHYKTRLMIHSNCDCEQIQSYIQSEKIRTFSSSRY